MLSVVSSSSSMVSFSSLANNVIMWVRVCRMTLLKHAFSLTVSLCDADSGEDEGAYAGGDKTGTEGESEYDGRW